MINSYWLGYAVGYWQNRIRPRLSAQYWRGYIAGMSARPKPPKCEHGFVSPEACPVCRNIAKVRRAEGSVQ
jgi:hypothetical protein